MRRGSFGHSAKGSGESEQGFWPSYADMMSTVALILFFLMLLSYIQNLITGNDLQNTQEVLENTRIQLEDTQDELSLTLSEVQTAEDQLARISVDLEDAKKILLTQQEEITGQKALIDEQEKYLSATNAELVKMRNQMQDIAVLRLSILEQIRSSIVEVMGDAAKVSIGENGSIILSEGVLFDLGSSAIKPGSKPVLDQLIQVFEKFLSDEENAKYVDTIVISGHTDSTGTDEENRILSTDRANSVLSYLLTGNKSSLSKYASYFCAAGYGKTRPVADNDTAAGREQNRRIEISMILKDETVLKIVDDYLNVELPARKP